MKRIIKSLMSVLTAAILLVSVFCLPASAASAVVMVSPSTKVSVGQKVTITGKYSGSEELYAFDGSISFESSKVKHVSGGTNQGSSVQFAKDLDGEKTVSVSATFEVIAEGSAYFKFVGNGSDGESKFTAQAGATVKISGGSSSSSTPTPPTTSSKPSTSSQQKPAASNNANLKSLAVEGAELSPSFAGSQTGYNTTVANTVESVNITAEAEDKGAKIEGTGAHALQVGENKLSVIVTAADGATKKAYSITVKRNTAEEDAAAGTQSGDGTSDPLAVRINGKSYKVITDISALSVPVGFTAVTTVYNDVEVGVLTEETESYKLYWLSDDASSQAILFKYNKNDGFERLVYAEIGGKFYIFETPESDFEAPSGYYETTVNFESGNAKAFAFTNSKMSDFYVVYCWCGGDTEFYRYDKREGTIQRAPDFRFAEPVESGDSSIVGWFWNLPVIGKIILIIGGVAVVMLVLLVVFIVLKVKNRNLASPVPMIGDAENTYSHSDGFTFGDDE